MFGMNDGFQEMMEQTQTLAKLWMDTASRMTGAAFAFTPGSTPTEANRQVRDAFLSSWGHSLEAYMRSEPFLRSMRQSLDMAMEMRKQFMQMVTQAHHSTGMVTQEDIRSVMMGIRHAEVRLSKKMDQLFSRFDEIESRLEELQDSIDLIKQDVEIVEAELGEPDDGEGSEAGASSRDKSGRTQRRGPAKKNRKVS
jgi:hypothetical protein